MILTCSFSFIPSSSWLSASNCFFNTSKQTVTREETVREWKWIFSKLIYSTFSYFLEVYLTNIGWETLFSAVLFKHDNKTFLFSCNLDNRDYHEVVILQVEYVATVHVLFHCIVLYCIVLYCIALYCIVLYCIVLYCIVLYCIVLYCVVLCCIVLYCIVLYCIVLHCIVLYCIVLYCIVLYCIVLYCIVLSCIVLYCVTVCRVVKCNEVHFNWL